MSTNRKDIIDELKSMDATFLHKDKSRSDSPFASSDLSDDFYQTVMKNVDDSSVKVIDIHSKKASYSSVLRVAASFVLLFTIAGILYAILPKMNTSEESLQKLIAETSSQELMDYLYEDGVPVDEEFIFEYVNPSLED